MEDKIKLLAKWLNDVEASTFCYDSYRSGKLERLAQLKTSNKALM